MSVHFARFLKAPWFFVGFFVLLGGGLRFWGIFHGLQEGFIYHPDAAHYTVNDAWNLYVADQWVGGTFKYNSPLYIFLHAFVLRLAEWVGAFFAIPIPWSFPLAAGLGSVLTAVLGTLTVWVVYGIGAQAYGRLAGVVAAGLFSVSPLHAFQSHYPYPDVAMTFFFSVTLLVSTISSQRFSPLYFCLSAFAAACAVATKLLGVAVGPAVLLSQFLAWRRPGSRRWAPLFMGLGLSLVLLSYYLLVGPKAFSSPLQVPIHFLSSFWNYFQIGLPHVSEDLQAAGRILWHWLDLPTLVLALAGVALAGWRRTTGDLILLISALSLLVIVALWPHLDERFVVPFTPIFATLSGRLVAEVFQATNRRVVKAGVVLFAVVLVFLPPLHRAARQGFFLSLPDTRFLAGKWISSHVPESMRLGIEGYYPLGANEWPDAGYFDIRRSFSPHSHEFDLIVTSSIEHGRYLERPDKYPEIVQFFSDLSASARLVKAFRLAPQGFVHSTIRIYWPTPPSSSGFYRVLLPRPYDSHWNGGVTWMEPGPYDKDDRTIVVRGGYPYSSMLVSEQPIRELTVFFRNGPAPSRVRIRIGWEVKRRTLPPHGQTVVRFRPKTPFWGSPAAYPIRVNVQSDEGVLVQLRQGSREVGEAYWSWGAWEQAIPPLESALAASPGDPELLALLALASYQAGRPQDAKSFVDRLANDHSDYLKRTLALGSTFPGALVRELAFDQAFAAVTGLNPGLLRHSLSRTFEAEKLERHGGTRVLAEGASGDFVVAFDPQAESPGVGTLGPYAYFPWGGYEAIFRLGATSIEPGQTVARLEIQAGSRVLATRTLTSRDFLNSLEFTEFSVLFSHENPKESLVFRLVALGGGKLWFDRVQVRPHLAEIFRLRGFLLRRAGLEGPRE